MISRELYSHNIKWVLTGSYALYLQGHQFNNNLPNDIDIYISSKEDLDNTESIFCQYLPNRTIIEKTLGEQIVFYCDGIKIEIYYAGMGIYNNVIDKAVPIKLQGVDIPCIQNKDELATRKEIAKIRGFFNNDADKISWLEKLNN
jgi:hypothetical protein